MRTPFTPTVPSAKHPLRRWHPSRRRGSLAALLTLLAAGALFGAGAVQAIASPARHQPAVAFDRAQHGEQREHRDHDRDRDHRHPGAGLTFAVHPPPAAQRSPTARLTAATPQPTLIPLRVVVLGSQAASPPSPAPARPSNAQPQSPSPGGAQPAPGLLPPVAVLPAPSPTSSSQPLMLPVVLLLTFVAILLVATVLTARRRT
jgi:hypothetical protein